MPKEARSQKSAVSGQPENPSTPPAGSQQPDLPPTGAATPPATATSPAALPPAPPAVVKPVAPAKTVAPSTGSGQAKVSAPIKHKDGTNHIVAECPFCVSRDTELVAQLTTVDQRRRCKDCRREFKLHVPQQK